MLRLCEPIQETYMATGLFRQDQKKPTELQNYVFNVVLGYINTPHQLPTASSYLSGTEWLAFDLRVYLKIHGLLFAGYLVESHKWLLVP